jgi:pentatricopeptide repeat protein
MVAPTAGQGMHREIAKMGLLEKNSVVGNMLVEMYSKCGLVDEAQDAFDSLQVRDVVSWNAVISGYAQHGNDNVVFHAFNKMVGEGREPNSSTFTILLNLCSHAGQLVKAHMCLDSMKSSYSVFPTLEHYTCIVDMFSRAGQVEQMMAVITDMPFHVDLPIWNTVLGACQKWGNVHLGISAFEHIIQLDETNAAAYVSLSNIFAASAQQGDLAKFDSIIRGKRNH